MTSLIFLPYWPFLSKRISIIENFKCHHIALNTLHRRHKYRDMIEQNASVMTVFKKSRLTSIKKHSNAATGSMIINDFQTVLAFSFSSDIWLSDQAVCFQIE